MMKTNVDLLGLLLAVWNLFQIDLSVAQFSLSPSTQIVTEGGAALFECRHPNANVIGWRINGTSISRYTNPDFVASVEGHEHTLRITAHSAYNGSMVECIALFADGQPTQISFAVELIVQGLLCNVSDLLVTTINLSMFITWKAPFTLNITDIEPDITYCVFISNISNEHDVLSVCNIVETLFVYRLMSQASCYENVFQITVTPVNRAGHGVEARIEVRYNGNDNVIITPEITQISEEKMKLRLFTENDVQVCNCRLLLWKGSTLYNFNTSNGLRCGSKNSTLEFSEDVLPFNDHYNGGFFITKTSISINISTYAIQNVIAGGTYQNTIHLRINYINETNVEGALLIILPIQAHLFDQQLPIVQIVAYSQQSLTIISKVPSGVYRVLAYDIDREGYLMMPIAKPSIICTVVVLGKLSSNDTLSDNERADIDTVLDVSDLTLTINCKYDRMSTAEGCMVILQSVVSPENLLIKMQQRESSKSLVFRVKAETNYTVTVFTTNYHGILNSMRIYTAAVSVGARRTTQHHELDVYKIVSGTVLSTSAVIIIILFIVLLTVKGVPCIKCMSRSSQEGQSTNIEMQTCEAYETVMTRRRIA